MKKFFSTLLVLALMFSMAFAVVGCNDDKTDENVKEEKNEATEEKATEEPTPEVTEEPTPEVTPEPTPEPTPTPKPTPKPTKIDITAEQLNNYYVAYNKTKGNEKESYVEVGFSNLTLKSKDGGTSFSIGNSSTFTKKGSVAVETEAIFNAHIAYDLEKLEKQGTATVAGKICTVYYYENGLNKIKMYVDETFGSTGICLKYEDLGNDAFTVEVTELEFGVINKEPGYEFATFLSKQATPAAN